MERRSAIQQAFEAKVVRKYCVSHNARIALFGKLKDLLFVNDMKRELDQSIYTNGIEQESILYENSLVNEDSDIYRNSINPQFENESPVSDMANSVAPIRKKIDYDFIPEPVSGAYVASILGELARGSIQLQPQWLDDPNFYEKNEEQTDERLLTLLLGDGETMVSL